jgi:hypothetical protein
VARSTIQSGTGRSTTADVTRSVTGTPTASPTAPYTRGAAADADDER